jgi:hypothetical protein
MAPYPDFPYPGYVATDKLHWLRAEFHDTDGDPSKLRIAQELLRRSEAMGDKIETVRWREEVRKRTHEVLPPPRKE